MIHMGSLTEKYDKKCQDEGFEVDSDIEFLDSDDESFVPPSEGEKLLKYINTLLFTGIYPKTNYFF